MIRNCLLNTEYSVRADHIYGLVRPILQGVMKHRINPDKRVKRVLPPTYILLHHKNIELYFDVFI